MPCILLHAVAQGVRSGVAERRGHVVLVVGRGVRKESENAGRRRRRRLNSTVTRPKQRTRVVVAGVRRFGVRRPCVFGESFGLTPARQARTVQTRDICSRRKGRCRWRGRGSGLRLWRKRPGGSVKRLAAVVESVGIMYSPHTVATTASPPHVTTPTRRVRFQRCVLVARVRRTEKLD